MSREIPLSKGMVAIVDDEDYERVAAHKWHFQYKGYASRSVHNGGDRYSEFMHRFIMNAGPGIQVDHVNLNTLDNRRENLRFATAAQNRFNEPAMKSNTSGFKGVSWSKPCGAWRAYITIGYKQHHLGLFATPQQAAEARRAAADKLHGEFARA